MAKILIARALVPAVAVLAFVLVLLALASPASASVDRHVSGHGHRHVQPHRRVHGALATGRHGHTDHHASHRPVRRHGAHLAKRVHGPQQARPGDVLVAARAGASATGTTRHVHRAAHTTTNRKPVASKPRPPVTLPRPVPAAGPQVVPPSVRKVLDDVPGVFSGRSGWLYAASALFATLMIVIGLVGWRPLGRVRR